MHQTDSSIINKGRFSRMSPVLALGAMAGIGLFLSREGTQENVLESVGLAFIISASLYDAFRGIIPNALVLTGLAVVLLLSFVLPNTSGVAVLLGAAVGGGLLLFLGLTLSWILKREALGGGDVKLMALIGGLLGWEGVFPVLFWAAVLALAWIACLSLVRGGALKRAVRFGPWMGATAFLAIIMG